MGAGKSDPCSKRGLGEPLPLCAAGLDIIEQWGFDRLIRAGNSCEVVNAVAEFCFSMVTHLVSSTLGKISELSSICKYMSVLSMIAAAQFTLLSYTPSCRVLAGRWVGTSVPLRTEGKAPSRSPR